MPTYPHGSRFHPTELGLVKLHLKNKVDDNISGFIKTLNVYGDAPWLLDHDTNPLYCRNEWYYFVPRTIRGVKTVSRMVPGNGDSFLGGTWKSIGKRKEIKNSAKELKGYKRELVFNKNVVGKSEKEKTDWHMDEYSLHKNGVEFHDLVLCHVRLLNTAEIFKSVVPAAHQVDHENNANNILQNQDQQEASDANQQQQQQQEQEDLRIPLHPPSQSNYNNQGRQYLLEASVYQNDMMIPENDRGYLNQQQQDLEDAFIPAHHSLQMNNHLEPCPFDDNAYHGAEDGMTGHELMPSFNDVNQQQHEQQQDSSTLPFQSNYNQRRYLLQDIVYQNDMMILKNDRGYLNQHQQQQQQQQQGQEGSRIPLHPPLQSNNNNQGQYLLKATVNQNGMMMLENDRGDLNQLQQQQQQEQEDQSNYNQGRQYLLQDIVYQNGTMMLKNDRGYLNRHQQQQQQDQEDSLVFPHPINNNLDIAFDGAYYDLLFDADELLDILAPIQSNDNHGQRPSWDVVLFPSQAENNSTVLPNQRQLEADFANQKGMSMVEKEHGDTKQVQEDLPNSLLAPTQSNDNKENYPSWADGSGFNGAEDHSITHNSDGSLTQQRLQELEIFIQKLNLSF